MPSPQTPIRRSFFEYLFGTDEGYVCIAASDPNKGKTSFTQSFFSWPEQREEMLAYIERRVKRHNLWYCTSLLDAKERRKDTCLPGRLVWADLDTCKPELVDPAPSIVVESSPLRYQALWRLSSTIPPDVAEEYSKRIAYRYNANGADPSGWDLTQLLRVPLTYNYKYEDREVVPEVLLLSASEDTIDPDVFEQIELTELKKEHGEDDAFDVPMPELDELPQPEWAIYRAKEELNRTPFSTLYTQTPDKSEDWSSKLWHLITICLEAGLTQEETLSVAASAACNKYRRDNRPMRYLWRDVLKADARLRRMNIMTGTVSLLTMPILVDPEGGTECWLDKYREWGSIATDAVEEYHELAGAVALSAVCANSLKLEASHGTVVPNIWGLILGDSTLTRKSTAMRMAVDIISELDNEYILATDGSAEGLLTGLSVRPNRTSIFFKDEVSGFFDSINRKDYLAGMPELLTQLYDSPPILVRRLRKETLTITNPVFIFFGGGIRDKVYELVTEQYILSGFLPRFLIVTGETDLSRVRRTGPRNANVSNKKKEIVDTLRGLHEAFGEEVTVKIGDARTTMPATFEAVMDDDAWEMFGDFEMKLMEAANGSAIQMIAMPTFTRMSFSILKLAMLLAATERMPDKDRKLRVTTTDLINSARFIQGWGRYTVDLLHNSGKTITERTLDKILRTIQNHPGITRSEVMRRHHMLSRDADQILKTLEDRGQLILRKEGRGYKVWPA